MLEKLVKWVEKWQKSIERLSKQPKNNKIDKRMTAGGKKINGRVIETILPRVSNKSSNPLSPRSKKKSFRTWKQID